jgi:hypothetical protein
MPILKNPLCLILLFCAMKVSIASSSAPITDPEAILAEIQTTGAKAVIAKLNATPNPNAWDVVVGGIKTGQAAWLEVAGKLASETDAGGSEDIKISLAYALPKNPAGVLTLVDSQRFLAVGQVCGAPFIEPTDAFLKSYLMRTKRSLIRMKTRKLEAVRLRCLDEIEAAQEGLFPAGVF